MEGATSQVATDAWGTLVNAEDHLRDAAPFADSQPVMVNCLLLIAPD